RASDDLEKTNTTYAEDSQPNQEITFHLDESDALSAASCRDGESERFVSAGYTGRRVSFNESALYEKEKATQGDKRWMARRNQPLGDWSAGCSQQPPLRPFLRYTLTEGDFHHLKKARLTHLHLPPAPCDLKILTIMECDSAGSSTHNVSEATPPNLPVTIYQPSERRVLDWAGPGLSGGLPGDTRHSTVLEPGPGQAALTPKRRSQTMEAVSNRGETEKEKGGRTPAPGQTSVLHFLSKLRRHASLEGAGPYFKRWKFDSSHRAASLDAKGSPKRRPFQRQRAASETTDHTEDESSPVGPLCRVPVPQVGPFPRCRLIQPENTGGRLKGCSLSDLCPCRLNLEVGSGRGGDLGSPTEDEGRTRQESLEAAPSLYRDIWSLRASLEQYVSSDQSSTDHESVRSDADSVSSLCGAGGGAGGPDDGRRRGEAPDPRPAGPPRGATPAPSGLATTAADEGRPPRAPAPTKARLRRRDYSIDEKTDALFNEFLRHDPRFDQQDSPVRARHRSRVHLRKQWQRHKQYSDPGAGAGGRYSPSLERQRFTPLRRGDSAGYPLDTR
uniref:CACN subunit beta associated regulatory protein n=1 Tax=Tetraodon nigroviridis TaxID=99883 RepID=H3C6M9_TETNG